MFVGLQNLGDQSLVPKPPYLRALSPSIFHLFYLYFAMLYCQLRADPLRVISINLERINSNYSIFTDINKRFKYYKPKRDLLENFKYDRLILN